MRTPKAPARCTCSRHREPLNRATGGAMSQITESSNADRPRPHTDRARALGYNLYAVYRTSWTGGGASTSTGHRRVVPPVDPSARDIPRVPRLPVNGFADGVQT